MKYIYYRDEIFHNFLIYDVKGIYYIYSVIMSLNEF